MSFDYVDIISAFCNDNGCLTRIGGDPTNGITTWDYGHLTPVASEYLAKKSLVSVIVHNVQDNTNDAKE